jgi:hypothetical protein
VEGRGAYKAVFPKDLLPQRRQIDVRNSCLPAPVVAPDLHAHRARHDLVPVADADDPDPVLREDLLHERDERVRPGDVGEGVVF